MISIALVSGLVLMACGKNVSDDPQNESHNEPEQPENQEEPEDPENPDPETKTIKILAIGHSFSEDAVEQELYPLFESVNKEIIIGNMYIGGCPLSRHADNARTDAAAYSYRKIVVSIRPTT